MATRIRVELNRVALARVASSEAGRLVLRTTRRTLNRARVLTPVDTGTLRASQTMEVSAPPGKVVGRVSTWVHYAPYVHNGVDHPVVIRPKRRKALRFVINGQVIFAKKVTLPPRAGRPWLRRALTEVAVPAGFTVLPG